MKQMGQDSGTGGGSMKLATEHEEYAPWQIFSGFYTPSVSRFCL